MILTLPVMLMLLFHLQISRFTPFTFTTSLPIRNDESKMELKKQAAILTLPFEPLLNIIAVINH
jgi:hypothetical protein